MNRRFRKTGYAKASKPRRQAGVMNRTESEYADMLELQRLSGAVAAYWYERMTLKLGADCRLTPDFMVLMQDGTLELHEVKGSLIRDDALAKLKMAADLYPFRFVMMQKIRKEWIRKEIASDTWKEAA